MNRENKYKIPVTLGEDREGNTVVKELDNLLIGGATGSGKSVFLNGVIYSLIKDFTPKELELVLIDSKRSQFYIYEDIDYLREPVGYAVGDSMGILERCVLEIEEREKNGTKNPYIVILIDEFADLVIQDPGSEGLICKIASNGKDVGVYILLSSSMASERVFTEKIKETIPNRLVGALVSKKNSLRLLGEEGGEGLEGKGDMIFKDMERNEKVRVQVSFISSSELES